MGRKRLDLAGFPLHIVQRGNNRLPCFHDDTDRRRYLRHLREASLRHACAVHAYVLMTNHVHLLVTPSEAGAISRMMQMLNRNYAGYFNFRHERCGTLWEGRFKSCLVDSDEYLLRCHRYIELNPVRAGMVSEPEAFAWSSYRGNALGRCNPLLTPHAGYIALGSDAIVRRRAYAALVAENLDDRALAEIRDVLRQERALGGERFRAEVESITGRCCRVRPAHRPPRRGVSTISPLTVSETVIAT